MARAGLRYRHALRVRGRHADTADRAARVPHPARRRRSSGWPGSRSAWSRSPSNGSACGGSAAPDVQRRGRRAGARLFASLCAQLRVRRPVTLRRSDAAAGADGARLAAAADSAARVGGDHADRGPAARGPRPRARARATPRRCRQCSCRRSWSCSCSTIPAARWLTRRIRTEREYSCDDIAIAATGQARVYARALAAIEDARCGCGLAVAAASGTLLDRIQRILDQPRAALSARRGPAVFAAAIVSAAALLAAAINVPPPSAPAGVRMRRPMPPASSGSLPRSPIPPGRTR